MTEEIERAELELGSRLTRWQEHWQEAVLRPGLADRPRFEAAATKIIRHYDNDWRGRFIWVDSPLVLSVAAPVASFITAVAGKHGIEERRAAFECVSDSCGGLYRLILADHFELSSQLKDLTARFGRQGVVLRDLFSEIQSAVNDEVHLEKQEEWAQLALHASTDASRSQAIVDSVRMAVMATTHYTRHDADELINRIMLAWPLDLLIHLGLNELGRGLFHLYERTDGAA